MTSQEDDFQPIVKNCILEFNSPKWKVATDPLEGRVMKATKDIKAGERIFVEQPLDKGPMYGGHPVCLG